MTESHVRRGELMERFYEVFPWPEDEESVRARLEEAKKLFGKLLEHPWLRRLLSRKQLRILDICGGVGVGGLGLALALRGRGVAGEVYVNDLRATALSQAARLAERHGVRAVVVHDDAVRLHHHVGEADIALLYGYSTPHFDPYQLVKLFSIAASILVDDGVFLVKEADRTYTILARGRYQEIHVEHADETRVVVSFEAGYDPRRGVFRRIHMELPSGKRAEATVRFHDIAGVAALLWVFFKNVDFIPTRSRHSGILVAQGPRRNTPSPEDFQEAPAILEPKTPAGPG